MSDSRVTRIASLTADANRLVNELVNELDSDHTGQHFLKWLQVRFTQASALASELEESL